MSGSSPAVHRRLGSRPRTQPESCRPHADLQRWPSLIRKSEIYTASSAPRRHGREGLCPRRRQGLPERTQWRSATVDALDETAIERNFQWGRSASAHNASTKPASAAGRSIGLAQAKGASTSAIVAPPPRPGRPRRARSPDSRGPIQWLARHRGHELDTGEPLGPRGIFTEREDQAPDAPTNKGRVCVHVRDRQHDARSRQENHHRGRDDER